ncbi:MAG: glycosyltransferase family 39 protein [Candidatus Dormiibacterota bacterium]
MRGGQPAVADRAPAEAGVEARKPGWKWAANRSLTAPLVLLLVLRLPSLFEPHWYNDEAGYATTAWLMAHGKVLFLTTWNNKPPLLFWLYQLAWGISGSRELGLHLLSTVTEVAALIGTWRLATQYLSRPRVWIATLVTACLLATPILNGDLALPEDFLIGFTVWGMVATLAALRAPERRRALLMAGLAGVLFGCGCLIQQTVLADLGTALLLVLLAGRRGWELGLVTAAGAAVVVAAVLAPFVAAAGLHNVVFFLVTSYSSYTTISLHPSFWSVFPRVLGGLLLVVGAIVARRWPTERLLPWVWLATLFLAYVIPNRGYLHFLLPAVPAAALLVARVGNPGWHRWGSRARLAGAPLLGSVLVGGYLWFALLGSGQIGGGLFPVKLTELYYPNFAGWLAGDVSRTDYDSLYSRDSLEEHEAVTWLRQNHLTGSTAVVWSPDAWAYLLGRLEPILPEPTIYMNSYLLGSKLLFQRVNQERPIVVIVTRDSYTTYGPIEPLLQRAYTEVQVSADGELWVRSDVSPRVPPGA